MDDYHPRLRANRDTFVFDLDNTLYPSDCALFPQVEKRIGLYVQQFMGMDPETAYAYQKELFMAHGTTLKGLMVKHDADPHDFLDYVHDIDFTPVKANPKLRQSLEQLDGRRIIYTNADKTYTDKVLERLGVADLFEGVYDILAADMRPKPDETAYEDLFDRYNIEPTRAIMFEDMVRNLVPAHKFGMGGVWINTGSVWGAADHHPDVVHAEADVLTPWLSQYVEARKSAAA